MCRAVLCRLLVVAMLVAPALHAAPTRQATPPATKVSSLAALDAFHQARHCLELGLNIESLSNVRQICNRNGVSDRCSASRQAWRAHRIEQFQRARSGCSADPKVQEADFRATLIAAVATGDPDVEDCYVEGWSNATSADIPTYVRTSEQLIAKGLARGDWRIVDDGLSIQPPALAWREWPVCGHGEFRSRSGRTMVEASGEAKSRCLGTGRISPPLFTFARARSGAARLPSCRARRLIVGRIAAPA